MLAAFKRLALVMVMAVLPLQGLAAVVIPVCQNDAKHGSSVGNSSNSDHRHADRHDHDASSPDQDQPLTVADAGPDHCGAGSVFAIPAILTEPAPAATAERGGFAAACRSGFVPEQPQRPPLV